MAYTKELFSGASHVEETAANDLRAAKHIELCPGGYYGSMILQSDLGDPDARIHYIEIRAGVPGAPARTLASFTPEDVDLALDSFFGLKIVCGGVPLYYNGGMCFEVQDKDDFAEALAEAFSEYDEDSDDDEDFDE